MRGSFLYEKLASKVINYKGKMSFLPIHLIVTDGEAQPAMHEILIYEDTRQHIDSRMYDIRLQGDA